MAPDLKREALRELPGRRRRDPEPPNWRDEVRRRMDKRRRQERPGESSDRAQSELPLFAEPRVAAPQSGPEEVPQASMTPGSSGPWQLGTDEGSEAELQSDRLLEARRGERRDGSSSLLDDDARRGAEVASAARRGSSGRHLFDDDRAGEFASTDLPLNSVEPLVEHVVERRAVPEQPTARDEWPIEDAEASLAAGQRPVDRPAQPVERLQAALVDLGVLAALGATVLYFAGRTAQVSLAGLQPAWPWLAFYLGLLALLYAAYFTGTTGQTLGKMLFDLRVVDGNGQAPGFGKALLRTLLGTLGMLALGLGVVPMLFDPAGRGLHDRLLRTRVVRPVA